MNFYLGFLTAPTQADISSDPATPARNPTTGLAVRVPVRVPATNPPHRSDPQTIQSLRCRPEACQNDFECTPTLEAYSMHFISASFVGSILKTFS